MHHIPFLDLQRINNAEGLAVGQTVATVALGGWYLKGPHTQRFEEAYARYIGTRHCVGCGNGLDALTLILRAYVEMGVLQRGDEVIVPANTYIASILSITECGLQPVLVEPDLDTLQIDDTLIEQALTPRTRAIMIVHLYGRNAYTERIGQLCQAHHLRLIEDNAQAAGCPGTGALGDAAAHSFYPTKNLGALGDAGAVTTNDGKLAAMVRSLGNYGSSRKYHFDHIGRNSRMDELQAAVLCEKLPHLDAWNRRRQAIAHYYETHVENPFIRLPRSGRDSVYHLFPVLCPQRDELQEYLRQQGIETQIHYPIPPHQQPCYPAWNHLSLPRTELIHRQELSIPCNQMLTDNEVAYIADRLNAFKLTSGQVDKLTS